jgi:hypothetical protein
MRSRSSVIVLVVLFVVAAAAPGGPLQAKLDTSLFLWFAQHVFDGDVPYRDFALEYPPGALVPLVAPRLAGTGHYAEAFKALELAAVVASLVLVYAVTRSPARVGLCALGLYALGPVLLIRFDPWAALLTLSAVAALVAAYVSAGSALLALAGATKLYALALVPVAWLYKRDHAGVRAFLVAGVAATLPFVLAGAGGVASSLQRQLGRGLELESLGASALLALDKLGGIEATVRPASGSFDVVGTLADAIALAQSVVLAGLVVGVYVLFARSTRDADAFLTASAAVVASIVALGKVLSPQFLVWALVVVVLVPGRRGLLASAVLVGASAVTHVLYPGQHEALVNEHALPVWILLVRNALLLIVAALLVQSVRALPRGAPDAARGSSTGPTDARSPSSSAEARAG